MTSNIENFCSSVAYRSYEVEPNNLKNLGIDISVIIGLVQVIAPIVVQLIQNCPNKSNLKTAVKKPNFLHRIKFRTQVKDVIDTSGYREYRALSGKVADAFIAEAAKLKDDDIDKMITEVNVDNWII